MRISNFLGSSIIMLFLLAIFCFAGYIPARAQKHLSLSGIVKEQNGSPVIGASVRIIGSSKGTLTDVNGTFILKDVTPNVQVSITMIGYRPYSFKFVGQKNMQIIIEEDNKQLDEVVVIGYGQMKKSDLTGSVSSVKTSNIADIPANSVEGLLQGRVAGVQIVRSSQDPGTGATVRIRGNSSLNGSNAPLVVVDGFPFGDAGDLKQINPQDIVSMEVLKDASASAIYGSRGANGVILITTRQAKKNTTKVMLRQQTTLSEFSSKLNLWRDPVLMAMMTNEGNTNAGLTPVYIGATNASGVYYPSVEELQTTWTTNTRWDDLVFRSAPVSNNSTVQIQSSNDRTTFLASANYYSEQGMYIRDNYNKYGGNFSVEHKVFNNLSIKASANITHNFRHNNGGLAYWRNPIYPVYDDNGNYWLSSASDYGHPLAITNLQKNESRGLDVISFATIDYQPLPCLNLKAQLNYKHGESTADQYYPKKYTETGTFNNGYGSISNWKNDYIVFDAYATFDKVFKEKHHVTAMGGYSYETDKDRSSYLAGNDFVNESLGNENLASGNAKTYTISNGQTQTELVSVMARLNYTFDNRYLVTFTARADGSSKFGKNNQWAFFPSGAISWKMSEEKFIKDLNVFDMLKLRASYGVSGNQGISAYQTLSRYGQHKYYNDGAFVTAIGPGYKSGSTGQGGIFAVWSGIANKDLKWESTAQLDFGLDMSFFNNRLNVTFDWYNKRTSDLLRERNIAPSSGYDKMWVNDGKIQNRGIELTLDGTIYQNRDWKVGGTLVYSRNRNKVLSLGNAIDAGLMTDVRTGMQYEYSGNSSEQFRDYTNILAIGKPMNVFYGYKVDGIVQTLAEGLEAGLSGDDANPGEFKYVDVYNGDNLSTVDENDKCIIGDPNPNWCASLALNASWKNLDFNIYLNGVFGNDVLNTKEFGEPNNTPLRWTPDNHSNAYPRLNSNRQNKISNWWIEDGSFVRIQNMTIGYTIPFNIKKMMTKARLYLTVDNLYTFTKFKGYDPEVGLDGIYWGGYPRLRKWTIGIDFTF